MINDLIQVNVILFNDRLYFHKLGLIFGGETRMDKTLDAQAHVDDTMLSSQAGIIVYMVYIETKVLSRKCLFTFIMHV